MLWLKTAVVAILVLGYCQCATWEIMGGGVEHNLPVFRFKPTVRFSASTPDSYSGMALLDDNAVLVGADKYTTYGYSFSKADGTLIKAFTGPADATNTGSLGWDSTNVYFYSVGSGKVLALDRQTGFTVWTTSNVLVPSYAKFLYTPFVWDESHQNFYFSSDANLFKISAADGTVAWTTSIAFSTYADNRVAIPTLSKIDNTLVLHTGGGDLTKINPNTGAVVWNIAIPTSTSPYQGQPTIDSQGYIYFGDYDQKIHKYDRDGNNIWVVVASTSFLGGAPILIKNETWLLFLGTNSAIYAVQTSDGTIITAPGLSTNSQSQAVAGNGVAYYTTTNGKLAALDYSDLSNMQILWEIPTGIGSSYGGPSIDSNGNIFVTGSSASGLVMLGCANTLFVVTRDGLNCDCPFRSFYDGSTCSTCDPNQFWDINSGCKTCLTGLVPSDDQKQCVFCDNGYIPDVNAAACEKCPNGTYTIAGETTCTSCPAGKVVNADKSGCMTCSAGTIALADQSGCDKCPENTFSNAGDAECTACSVEPTNPQCPQAPVAAPIAAPLVDSSPVAGNGPTGTTVPKAQQPSGKLSSASSISISFLSLIVLAAC